MTEREIREVREQWDKAHSRWQAAKYCVSLMQAMADDLSAECERLAEIIAEHDNTPIMVVEPIAAAEAVRERPIVITEDDGDEG